MDVSTRDCCAGQPTTGGLRLALRSGGPRHPGPARLDFASVLLEQTPRVAQTLGVLTGRHRPERADWRRVQQVILL